MLEIRAGTGLVNGKAVRWKALKKNEKKEKSFGQIVPIVSMKRDDKQN